MIDKEDCTKENQFPLGDINLTEMEEFAKSLNRNLFDTYGYCLSMGQVDQVAIAAIKTIALFPPNKLALLIYNNRKRHENI